MPLATVYVHPVLQQRRHAAALLALGNHLHEDNWQLRYHRNTVKFVQRKDNTPQPPTPPTGGFAA